MKTKSVLLILLIFLTVQVNSQVRKQLRSGKNKGIKFEYKVGDHKLKIPGTKSVLTLHIKGRDLKIVSITRTTNGKTYKLKYDAATNCFLECPCGVECWKDPVTRECICICKPCSGDGDEISGQIEFLSPN